VLPHFAMTLPAQQALLQHDRWNSGVSVPLANAGAG
jgi:hypothetical protein